MSAARPLIQFVRPSKKFDLRMLLTNHYIDPTQTDTLSPEAIRDITQYPAPDSNELYGQNLLIDGPQTREYAYLSAKVHQGLYLRMNIDAAANEKPITHELANLHYHGAKENTAQLLKQFKAIKLMPGCYEPDISISDLVDEFYKTLPTMPSVRYARNALIRDYNSSLNVRVAFMALFLCTDFKLPVDEKMRALDSMLIATAVGASEPLTLPLNEYTIQGVFHNIMSYENKIRSNVDEPPFELHE